MKRFYLVLIFLLIFSTVSCSPVQPKEMATTPESITIETATWPLIGSCVYKGNDVFMLTVFNAMEREADLLSAGLEIVDSENSQSKQNDQFDSYLKRGMDAMIINLVDITAGERMVDKARDANLPLIFLYRVPLKESYTDAWLISDEEEEPIWDGYDKVWYVSRQWAELYTFSGQILADYLLANPATDKNGDGKIQYVKLNGEPGYSHSMIRPDYSVEALEDAGFELDELAGDTAVWDRENGKDVMERILSETTRFKVEDVEAILADNDEMALGAIDALQAIGYNTGDPEKYIPVVGIDATSDALDAIEKGFMLGTVLNDAETQGKTAIRMAVAAAKGQELNKETIGYDSIDGRYVWIPNIKITKENVAQYRK